MIKPTIFITFILLVKPIFSEEYDIENQIYSVNDRTYDLNNGSCLTITNVKKYFDFNLSFDFAYKMYEYITSENIEIPTKLQTKEMLEDYRSAFSGEDKVKYFNSEQLLKFELKKEDIVNGLILNSSGEAMNIEDGIYVMDKNGKIYIHSSPLAGVIQHSSLSRGQSIAAAGEITIYNGKVQKVNNKSGHYRPEAEYLQQFRDSLKGLLVNLDETRFELIEEHQQPFLNDI